MKIGDVVTYKGLHGGWIGVVVPQYGTQQGEELPDDLIICYVQWYDGSITEELIEMLEVVDEAR